jgi:AcrR family transcriptional regulator
MNTNIKQDPRWSRTRKALLQGGRRIMALKGVDAASVSEIVREAGVSQPSFYNHFDSKEALAEAIVADFFQADASTNIRLFEELEDPAEAIAFNARHTLNVATRDPIVAWVLVRAGATRDLLRTSAADDLVKMIESGIAAGRFQATNARTVALVIRGSAISLMQDVLQGSSPVDAERQFAELILRMLGVEAGEAAEIASREEPQSRR